MKLKHCSKKNVMQDILFVSINQRIYLPDLFWRYIMRNKAVMAPSVSLAFEIIRDCFQKFRVEDKF